MEAGGSSGPSIWLEPGQISLQSLGHGFYFLVLPVMCVAMKILGVHPTGARAGAQDRRVQKFELLRNYYLQERLAE